MEIKKRLDFRIWIVGLYVFALLMYLVVGFIPAGATEYEISSRLTIPSADIQSDVTKLSLEDNQLKTPDTIVGSFSRSDNKTLLIGHSSTVFSNLHSVKIGDEIIYDDTVYYIYNIELLDKSDVKMSKILKKAEKDTLVLMTCAGERIGETDAIKRLIIEASV